jgi:hypothetical protein
MQSYLNLLVSLKICSKNGVVAVGWDRGIDLYNESTFELLETIKVNILPMSTILTILVKTLHLVVTDFKSFDFITIGTQASSVDGSR